MASPPRQLARRNSNKQQHHLPNIEINRRSDHDQPVTTATITTPSRSRLNTGDLKRKKSPLESSHNNTLSTENVAKFTQRSSSSDCLPDEQEEFSTKKSRLQPEIQAQTPTQLTESQGSSLAGELHTGCTQQLNSMNFGLNLPSQLEFSTPRLNSADAISAIHEILGGADDNALPPLDLDESYLEVSTNNTSDTRLRDYKWAGNLGAGGSSLVYKAYVEGSEYHFIAIKRFENPSETDPEDVKRKRKSDRSQAINEIEMLTVLDGHPNVIKMGKYEEETDFTYLELELMDISLHDYMNQPQGDLKRMLSQTGKYSQPKLDQATTVGVDLYQISYWAACAVEALAHFHENGYCHADVKSGNFLLKYQTKELKLADLGLTRYTRDFKDGPVRRFFDLAGTPSNYAPEMWMTSCLKKGNEGDSSYFDREEIRENLERLNKDLEDYIGYGCAVDIWALGCVLVHLASGKQLYYKENSEEFMYNECMMFQIHHCKYSFTKAVQMLPSYLEDDPLYAKFLQFLEACFEHSPVDRASASELLDFDFLKPDEEDFQQP